MIGIFNLCNSASRWLARASAINALFVRQAHEVYVADVQEVSGAVIRIKVFVVDGYAEAFSTNIFSTDVSQKVSGKGC